VNYDSISSKAIQQEGDTRAPFKFVDVLRPEFEKRDNQTHNIYHGIHEKILKRIKTRETVQPR
jgi:hypothetical protein